MTERLGRLLPLLIVAAALAGIWLGAWVFGSIS